MYDRRLSTRTAHEGPGSIRWRWAMTAGFTAASLFGLMQTPSPVPGTMRLCALLALLIVAAEIDRRRGIIPNRLVLVGALVGAGLTLLPGAPALITGLVAGSAAAAVTLLLRRSSVLVFHRPGFGLGDVKLLAVLGLILGWNVFPVFYLAVCLAGAFGLLGLLAGRLERESRLPFAPFLTAGTLVHVFVLPPHVLFVL